MTSPLFVKSNDTARLESLLREAAEGEVVTYEQMTAAIGRNVREHAQGSLVSARRIVGRDGIHTAAVPSEGIRRLTPAECVGKAKGHVGRARRAAIRSRQTIETTDFERLEDSAKAEALAVAAQAGAIELFGSRPAARKLLNKTQGNESLSLGQTLELFSK